MINKLPRLKNPFFLSILVLAFTVTACNNKKEGDKKEPPADTSTVKPMDQPPPPPVDTMNKMNGPTDTVKKKPVKDPS